MLVVPGSLIGHLLAHDDDKEGTLNSQLTYTIVSQTPTTESNTFFIDESNGDIKALRVLRRNEHQVYNLQVRVSDSGNKHTRCMEAHLCCQPARLTGEYGPQFSAQTVR